MNYLTHKQKAVLCQMAKRAWDLWPEREAFLDANPEYSTTAAFEAWRRNEQMAACGVSSLKSCTSERHFLLLRAHWNAKIGAADRAARDLLKHADEACLIVLHKIYESCLERGLDYPVYPGAICRRQYKCALEEASERQLWNLCYTVRKRRRKGGAKPKKTTAPTKTPAERGAKKATRPVSTNLPF